MLFQHYSLFGSKISVMPKNVDDHIDVGLVVALPTCTHQHCFEARELRPCVFLVSTSGIHTVGSFISSCLPAVGGRVGVICAYSCFSPLFDSVRLA